MSEETPKYDIRIEPGEEEVSEAVPVSIFGDGLLIFDPTMFAAIYDCHAARVTDGTLYVLCRKTNRWRSVEPPPLKAAK